jgi:hypothetical protein
MELCKYVRLLLVVAAGWFFTLNPNLAYAQSMMLVPSAKAVGMDEEFSLDVRVEATNLFGASIELRYDGSLLEVMDVSQGDFLGNDIVFFKMAGDGNLSMAASRKAGTEGVSGTGVLATITFKGIRKGTTDITFHRDTLSLLGQDGGSVEGFDRLAFQDGEVIICIRGDVNDDSSIRSNDAILALRIAAGLMTPTPQQECAADTNRDGKVRANDAIIILRKAAGLEGWE